MKIPSKLKAGNQIRVIAPALSLSTVDAESIRAAETCFKSWDLEVTFGRNARTTDPLDSSSIEARISDLHEAFADPSVHAIIAANGGHNSNQLLKAIDYSLIEANPKIFCGYSDITALQNAIFARTGLITYSGPNFCDFAPSAGPDYTLDHFEKCLFDWQPFELAPSKQWFDTCEEDESYSESMRNPGYGVLNEGQAEGTIVGGNISTIGLLQGTPFMPSLKGAILFLEDDDLVGEYTGVEFDRKLQSLIHLPDFDFVRGLVIGRFQRNSEMSDRALKRIIENKPELQKIPVISGADFGHTSPQFTFPIGGSCEISAASGKATIQLIKH